jgi:hypothetical protein
VNAVLREVPLVASGRRRRADCAGSVWLQSLELWQPDDPDALVTGDGETALLLLGGTFDLVGGGTAWPARGARKDPFNGRPMAVFLPPKTPFRVSNGGGEILLVAARQPAPAAEPSGRAAFAQKPLLPMAGSGKSFDPNSGEWRPAETFPSAPESLPPRRFERLPVGGCIVERVFAPDYKAATLSVDEVVIPAGQSLALADIPAKARGEEVLVFTRTESTGELRVDGRRHPLSGDAVSVLAGAGDGAVLRAAGGAMYAVLAWAGKVAPLA